MESREEIRRRLLEKANTLPLSAGVYIMRDGNGRVIYVGKSRKLKNRVSQYFQNAEKGVKTERMVSMVREFDYYLCDNEMEALSLEYRDTRFHELLFEAFHKDALYHQVPDGVA